ncbi:MAG: Hsp20/alpha crystallin family protein [Candidatus Sphingomonas colombiensis]|nr:Hsp20/alpha crystallin family protein [Sphingomonas sp.]WEK43209.1 MAG: Hsp20/alpha crystallin family protein [Sphingomonas sp.]
MTPITHAPPRRSVSQTPFGWLRTEIDRLFDDFSPSRAILHFGTEGFAPAPALEMTSGDNEYRLTAELPGIKEDDVELSVADGMLKLRGDKREVQDHKQDGHLLGERCYGSFERNLPLPADVNYAAISAEFRKGVLTVTLPKNAEAAERSRRIAITNSD